MTTLTNVHDINDLIVSAIANDPYEKRGDISVTTLIRPPQMVALEAAHQGEIVTDAGEGLWLLLGRSVHSIIESLLSGAESNWYDLDRWLIERPMTCSSLGWTVSGTPDLWRPLPADPEAGFPAAGGELVDFKVTSVWSFLLEGGKAKPEWEEQLNLYAYMLSQAGRPVTKVTILAILRDHLRSKAKQDPDYPEIPFQEVTVPLWGPEIQREFLETRVKLHQQAQQGDYPPCTDAERWAKPEKWAVMKKGRQRAVKLFESDSEATAWKDANRRQGETLYLEHRPGAQTRCEDYCPVSQWCDQARELGVR